MFHGFLLFLVCFQFVFIALESLTFPLDNAKQVKKKSVLAIGRGIAAERE
jgi:hypothetical protein